MLDGQHLTVLGLGFLFGVRHALDADHVAAVAAMISHRPDFRASGFIGLCWGIGHTLILLVVVLAVVGFKISIPQSLTDLLEAGVGGMLLLLGGSLLWRMLNERWHLHAHDHDGKTHLHLHSHLRGPDHAHYHWLRLSLKPLAVGMAHGLAGSAALGLLLVSANQSLWEGFGYILVFGLGTILGMSLLGLAMSVPLVWSVSLGRRALVALQGLASVGSISLGLLMISRLTF